MRRTRPAQSRTQGAVSNYRNLPLSECEPAGHGIGRSRGGLTTKIHAGVDGHGRPLAVVITGGQRNDGAMLAAVLADIRVPRLGGGRPAPVLMPCSPTGEIGTVADAYDNALMETINGLFKAERIRTTVFHPGPFTTSADVEYATASRVDWYNNRRRHPTLVNVPPVEYEQAPYAALN